MKADDIRKSAMEVYFIFQTLTKKLGPTGNGKSNVEK